MNKIVLTVFPFLSVLFFYTFQERSALNNKIPEQGNAKVAVPLGGNSWVTKEAINGNEQVTDNGWINWENKEAVFSIYIGVNKPGKLKLSAMINVPSGESVIQLRINGVKKEISVGGTKEKEYGLGEWEVSKGYNRIDVSGISRTGPVFALIKDILIEGNVSDKELVYVKDNTDNYFYWGRRGPSVHINYDISTVENPIKWFYNEIKVPENNDPVGSYFMADGFGEGYFGMQVNSPVERRVLFSVWSPFATNDPSAIPDDKKIKLLKKGENVYAGEFGNEGAGGQSYLKYNWKAGETYAFLLKAEPGENNYTNYTAYFYSPEQKKWLLIASFGRPATQTYLTHLHSFLENFEPNTGYITRKAYYQNQWVVDKEGKWISLNKMKFTADATARKGYRKDYKGGAIKNVFFLQNCGFFNDSISIGARFVRKKNTVHPNIDFASLE